MCQFLLTKTCRYKSRSEKDKNQETAKTNEPNKHEVHTFYVLHWLYFMTSIIFLRNRLLQDEDFTSEPVLSHEEPLRNMYLYVMRFTFCSQGHVPMQFPHDAVISSHSSNSQIPAASYIKLKDFWKTITHLLAHFDALLIHFSIFYSLLIFQKSTEVWCKILQISNITKMVKLLNFGTAASSKINGSLVSGDAHWVSNAIR